MICQIYPINENRKSTLNDLWTGIGILCILVGVFCVMVAYKLPGILKETKLEIEKERTRQKELEFGR